MKLRWLALLAVSLSIGTVEARSCRNPTDAACSRQCIASAADTSGNGRTAYAIGVKPQVVSAPLVGLSFDGLDRDGNSSGLFAGVTGFGVSTADGSMKVKATIRRSRTGVFEWIGGKWGNSSAVNSTDNYLLGIDNTNKLVFYLINSVGTAIVAVGTTSLTTGVNYDIEGEWTGTALNVKVGGVQEGTTPAITALQAPDSVTPFTIGIETWNSADASSPYPFQGTIANVEMYRGGVLQGAWTLASLACP